MCVLGVQLAGVGEGVERAGVVALPGEGHAEGVPGVDRPVPQVHRLAEVGHRLVELPLVAEHHPEVEVHPLASREHLGEGLQHRAGHFVGATLQEVDQVRCEPVPVLEGVGDPDHRDRARRGGNFPRAAQFLELPLEPLGHGLLQERRLRLQQLAVDREEVEVEVGQADLEHHGFHRSQPFRSFHSYQPTIPRISAQLSTERW